MLVDRMGWKMAGEREERWRMIGDLSQTKFEPMSSGGYAVQALHCTLLALSSFIQYMDLQHMDSGLVAVKLWTRIERERYFQGANNRPLL